jgi:hypothetical protein
MGYWPSTLSFRDLDFDHATLPCWSKISGWQLKWVPIGVPRLNSNLAKMVFFLHGRKRDGSLDPKPIGTGVFVILPSKSGGRYDLHKYAVTCWHVTNDVGASVIRVNTTDGKSRDIDLGPEDWHFIPNGPDVAAVDVTDLLRETDDVMFVQDRLFATKDFIKEVEFGIGEDGFMLGMFTDMPAAEKNLIVGRFGNVSFVADDAAPIEQYRRPPRPSHIFDIRSRPGFSGSPVFCYRTPTGDLREASERGRMREWKRLLTHGHEPNPIAAMKDKIEIEQNTFLVLLGIHVMQYHDTVTVEKLALPAAEADKIRVGDELRVPNSMTVVAPIWDIMAVLSVPHLVEQRTKRETDMGKKPKSGFRPESAKKKSDADDADNANPRHKEDFTRLLGVAAKTKPQAD